MHQSASRAAGSQEVEKQVHHLGVQDGRRLEMFSRCGSSGENEDSRADDGADAQRRERPRSKSFLQAMLGLIGFGNQFVYGFAAE